MEFMEIFVRAQQIQQFFPAVAPGHGGGIKSGRCPARDCSVGGGRNKHGQDRFSAAKAFVKATSQAGAGG